MAKLTNGMIDQLQSILDSAQSLPKPLKDFAEMSIHGFMQHVRVRETFYRRKDLQQHIDTLKHLITLGVHDR